ncbi:MAG: hypothetical protein IPJ86_15675 [Bacteroidetes bacterium]|nr:hypothetical protein [Bacteroidota bacterium]
MGKLKMKSLLSFNSIQLAITTRKDLFFLVVMIFSLIDNCKSQTWATVDTTEFESVRITYYDSVTSTYILGGRFDTLFNVDANNIIAYDGVNWFPMGDGFNRVVTSIIRFNGELFAAGAFDSSGSVHLRAPIAKWDGANWVPVDTLSHYDDKSHAIGQVPSIQDMCIHNGDLYLCGDFLAYPNFYHPMGYADLAKYNGNYIESVLFHYFELNCSTCNIESFKGNLYMAKNAGTKDTCLGTPVSFPTGLLIMDTLCWTFKPVGQWPVTRLYGMLATDSMLYIGLDYPSTTFGNFFTGYDGANYHNIGGGLNGPVGYVHTYNGKILVSGAFSADFNNTVSLSNFALLNGLNWQPLGSTCNLNYGLGYVSVLDSFIFASGFFDSCGVNPVGYMVTFPNSIITSINDVNIEPPNPKVIIKNGYLSVEFDAFEYSRKAKLFLYDAMGRMISGNNCCSINLNPYGLVNGIYFLEIIVPEENFKRGVKFVVND